MSSPFFSELSKLDDSLRTIQSKVDRVRGGLEFAEEELKQSLDQARQHAAALRDLILAETTDAKWSDRDALEHLILGLEIAADERRKEQRQTALLNLASELEAGSVKHRVSARASALNALRLKAVEQLKAEAARPEQEKQLPGPGAREWVHWVCGVQQDTHAPALAQLATDFPALLEFAVEMEETFWVPREGAHVTPAAAIETPAATAKAAAPVTSEVVVPPASKPQTPAVSQPQAASAPGQRVPVRIKAGQLPPHIRAEFDKALRTGDFTDALSLCYDKPANETQAENASSAEANAKGQPAAAVVAPARVVASEPAPPPLKFCTECGRTYPNRYNVCPFDSTALRDLPDSVPEPASTVGPSLVGDTPSTDEGKPVATTLPAADVVTASSSPEPPQPEQAIAPGDEAIVPSELVFAGESTPSFGELTVSKRPIATWVAAGVLVVLIAVFIWMHYFQGSNSRVGSSVANAATNPDPAATSSNGSDPSAGGAKALLHREASEGPQEKILLSMENCERTIPAGIECWGYISNQRDKDSKVSLYRVDVIDGKGNSFDLTGKGHADFSDTHDFNIPAQSKVKYSIKVPDSDKEARTLTLYLDVNNPRLSEYTFRDVPISD